MTATPRMVALFNGMGGGAAALSSTAEFLNLISAGEAIPWDVSITTVLGVVIGSISAAGSVIALGKLQGFVSASPITYRGQQIRQRDRVRRDRVLGIYLIGFDQNPAVLWGMLALALVLGVAMVLPIGGADMPVVISLLNSFTGLAAAFTGFVLHSNVLIISGALVGASGYAAHSAHGQGDEPLGHQRAIRRVRHGHGDRGRRRWTPADVHEITPDYAATLMAYAHQVVIVPGYGMAVAQAQHAVQELANLLEEKGVEVKYAIHPVAGRMPGHMNVLLAEANVPYDQLFEMDDINPEFPRTDVALVIGANDVVNPAARTDPKSPIYGMPILDVDRAGNVIMLKRCMKSGFAGIDNDLFYEQKTSMLFGDAKDTAQKLVQAVKQL